MPVGELLGQFSAPKTRSVPCVALSTPRGQSNLKSPIVLRCLSAWKYENLNCSIIQNRAQEGKPTDGPCGYIGPGRGLNYGLNRRQVQIGSVIVERRECELK